MNATRLLLSSLVLVSCFEAACGGGSNTTLSTSSSSSGFPESTSTTTTTTTGMGGFGGSILAGTGGTIAGTGGMGTTGGTGTTGGMGTTGGTGTTSGTTGGAATGGMGATGGSDGGPGGCTTAGDCPPTGNECIVATCTNGTCGDAFVPMGTPTSMQTAGDCKKNECDGMGAVKSVVDDTDLPVDNNPCTNDVCTAGVPSNPPASAGTACGAGLTCNATGMCVGCNTASDCPGQDTDCMHRACTGGMCVPSFTAAGTPTTMQTAGDCKKNVCDGMGNVVSQTDNTDVPVDGNPCTSDVCTAGVPSNPPVAAGTMCSAMGGAVCNATGMCVGCNTASDCPGQDTDCKHRTCTAGACGSAFTAAGTPTSMQTAGDCKKNVCDGMGNVVSQTDDTDVPVDGNACTSDVCTAGVPSNPPAPAGTPCGSGGAVCNGMGMCAGCVTAGDCPPTGNPCLSPVCNAGACGTTPVAMGTPTSMQTPGDCHTNECDGMGNVMSVVDDTDVPVDGNACTGDVCMNGVPSNPALPARTACNQGGGTLCDGNGACVQCLATADCPATGNECLVAACTAGACTTADVPQGTPTSTQTPGDCHTNECDGMGHVVVVVDDTDVPVDGNPCTSDVCTAGVPSNPPVAAGTACSQSGGVVCDGTGACTQSIAVVRLGTGAAALSSAAAAVFVEQYYATGASVGAPIALPTAASGNNQPFTMSGTSTAEGGLSRSADGRYLTLAGYAAAPGTASVKSTTTASTNRVVARIDATGAYDTSSRLTSAFSGDSVRGATSSDGTGLWVSGTSSGTTGGVWYLPFGMSGGTQIVGQSGNLPGNTRAVHVFGGQLYGTAASGAFQGVFSVGAGLPMMQSTATMLPGLPTTSGPSPYSFALFDLNAAVPGLDTLYVADDRAVASGGGIQKWTFDGTTWTLSTTLSNGLTSGCRGLTGWVVGTGVMLAASTADAAGKLVIVFDNGSPSPAFSTIATAASNEVYRGVALSPH